MKRRVKTSGWWLVSAVALLGLLAGPGRAAAQTTAPEAVVRGFLESITSGDEAMMQALIDPKGVYVSDVGTANEFQQTLAEFAADVAVQDFTVVVNSATLSEDGTVAVSFSVSGGDIPSLPSPYTFEANVTVADGKITRWEEVVSAQTLAELAALSNPVVTPGMPTTGNSSGEWLGIISLLSLAALASGVVLRRRASAQR